MSIRFDDKTKIFQLNAGECSYVIMLDSGYPVHLYWGDRLDNGDHSYMLKMTQRSCHNAIPFEQRPEFSLDTLPQEYSAWGRSDLRKPAFEIINGNGFDVVDLQYAAHRIFAGKPKLEGLPATYTESDNEADTLEIDLTDHISGITVTLRYTAFNNTNVITRSVTVKNQGSDTVKLKNVCSAMVDFDRYDFDVITSYGAWAREQHIERIPLHHGTVKVDSRRGASGHIHNPYLILCDHNTDEEKGKAYGFSLVYSGNFEAGIETDMYYNPRAFIGIMPERFSWRLNPNETFTAPEAVLVYSNKGLGEMSRTYHSLYRRRLCRSAYRDKPRPVLLNSWEAFYMDFNEEKIVELAKQAHNVGIELLVMDDGWFGERDDDTCSLGDWNVNLKKLPNGIDGLADKLSEFNMKLGIWFEPEMVSPKSNLFSKHPEWCIQVRDYPMSMARFQYVLDLTRSDVREFIFNSVSDVLKSGKISYVKWDMNRYMTETGSLNLPDDRQEEIYHRYILGLYSVLERLTSAYPNVLFEGCASGGGRFDPGMLYYFPQFWTSDDTDAVERLKIQYGTSMIYPLSAVSAHVSESPNHQIGRKTDLSLRTLAAYTGAFGYELDLGKLSDAEKEQVKNSICEYKKISPIISQSNYYRLRSPFETNESAYMYVNDDKTEALVFYFNILAKVSDRLDRLTLFGLDPDAFYEELESGKRYSGRQLMCYGINLPQLHDFEGRYWHIKRV